MMDYKYLRYRTARIASSRGISIIEAREIAKREIMDDLSAAKKSKIERLRAISRERMRELKRKNKKIVYVANGKVVNAIVSGGLPTLGKR